MRGRSRVSTKRVVVLTAVLGLAGCTVEAPWGKEGSLGWPCFRDDGTCDDGLTCSAGICLGGGGACVLQTTLTVEAIPKTTPHDHVAVRGTVGSNATEVVVASGTKVERLPAASGSFCAEIPLNETGATEISVVARDDSGCVSAPQIFPVTYSPNGVNVIAGLTPRGLVPRVESLTDGDTSTTQTFSFSDARDPPDAEICDTYTYVWFALPQPETIQRMIVRYPEGENFTSYVLCWSLLVSNERAPGVPFPARSDAWSVVGQSVEGRRNALVYDLEQPTTAQHVALLLFEDGARGETEHFEISEIELYGPPVVIPYVGCE